MPADLAAAIEAAWDRRADIGVGDAEAGPAVASALAMLDSGKARVAEPDGQGGWRVNQWLKKAVLLSFRLSPMEQISGATGGGPGPSTERAPRRRSGGPRLCLRGAGFAGTGRGTAMKPAASLFKPIYDSLFRLPRNTSSAMSICST